MAERSKAPVSGTGLFGGVGSNPTPIILFSFCRIARFVGVVRLLVGRLGAENGVWVKTDNKHTNNNDDNKKLPRLGIAPRLPRPQRGVLLLYYLGDHTAPRFARNQQT